MVKKFILIAILNIGLIIFFSCRSKSTATTMPKKDTKFFSLLPYTNFDTALIDFVQSEITNFYSINTVSIMPQQQLPDMAFYKARNRYKADSLLRYQNSLRECQQHYIVGLTAVDISTTNSIYPDWGVFGLGYCPGNAAIISTYRIGKVSKSKAQLKERLAKVVLHEVGHNFGLPHCNVNTQCLMNDAGGQMKQVDRERKWLCDNCKKQLSN
jgi:archaemetzincin